MKTQARKGWKVCSGTICESFSRQGLDFANMKVGTLISSSEREDGTV